MTEHDLMRRAFEIDVLACPRCGNRMRLLATIEDPQVVGQILTHLGLPSAPVPDVEDDIDAFLKRFEQFVNAIHDEAFKAVAVLGAVPSAATFRTLVAIRNRIAHVYPDDPQRQAGNRNGAYAAVNDVLAAHAAVRRYLERRLPLAT